MGQDEDGFWSQVNKARAVRRWQFRRENSLPAIIFFPMWLTGVAGVIGCACSSRANSMRWVGVFVLPFSLLPWFIAKKWLGDRSVSGEIRHGRYGPVTGYFNIDRAEYPIVFWSIIALCVAMSLGVLAIAILLMIGYWRLS